MNIETKRTKKNDDMPYLDAFPASIELTETTSTNSFLSALCDKQPVADLTCAYTTFQSAGRGQRGNSWESEAGKNLLFSFVVYPSFLEAHRQFLLSQVTALALYQTLSEETEGISIKWPNDIYWHDKKLCGTLIENDLTGIYISRSISGTGVNLNQLAFTSDAPNPISLRQITGRTYDIRKMLKRIMTRISTYYDRLKKDEGDFIAYQYKKALYRRDGYHAYKDEKGSFRARIVDVEPIGKLVLEDENALRREYMFKEVSFLL